jgi:hypothetical protein
MEIQQWSACFDLGPCESANPQEPLCDRRGVDHHLRFLRSACASMQEHLEKWVTTTKDTTVTAARVLPLRK